MELMLFLLAACTIGFLLLHRKRSQAPKIYSAAPSDNPCKPHSWARLSDMLVPELAAEVSTLIQNNQELKESLIGIAATSLICKSCGYVSGSDICIDIEKFIEAVEAFVADEKEKLLV